MAINAGPDIIEDGIVLCLDAANSRSYPGTGTTWTDLTGGNDGALANGPSFVAENGGVILLDGSDDIIWIADNDTNALPITDFPLTVAVWIKTTDSKAYIFNFTSQPSDWNEEYDLYIQDGKTKSRIDGNTANFNSTVENPSTINDGNWHYVVSTSSSSSNHETYIDGQLINTFTTDVGSMDEGTGVGLNSFALGVKRHQPDGTYQHYSQAHFGICKVYNRGLTESEIRQNYNATKGRYA
jgi:hypothetical protein